MTAPARFRQADLERAMKATAKAGVREYRVRIEGGVIDIFVGGAANDANETVELE